MTTPSPEEIGRCLHELRVEQGLEPADVARRSGFPVEQINEIEAGRVDPSAQALARLAEALGASMGLVCRRIESGRSA